MMQQGLPLFRSLCGALSTAFPLALYRNLHPLPMLKFEQAEIMNFLDNYPSENRMEFTKLQVACKYASIGRVYACR